MARPRDIEYTIRVTPNSALGDMLARKSPNKDGISELGDPSQYVKAQGNAIVSRDAAACYLTIETGSQYVVASGGAKRNKGDQFDFEIGANLAIGRALKAAGEEFEKRAWERVPTPTTIPKGEVKIYFTDSVAVERGSWVNWPTDPNEPTLAELEREKAEEAFLDSIDRDDPDAEGNERLDNDEVRLSLYDRIKELWR